MLSELVERVLFSFARERSQIGRVSKCQRPFDSFWGFGQKEYKQSLIARSKKKRFINLTTD